MPDNPAERRGTLRRAPGVDDGLIHARLRAGRELTVIDLSEMGACVEGQTRLFPGTRVELQIPSPGGRTFVHARVLRCDVRLVAADCIRYRAAVAFESRLDGADGKFVPDTGR